MFLAFILIFLILAGSQALMQKFYPKPATPPAIEQVAATDQDAAATTAHDLPATLPGGASTPADTTIDFTSPEGVLRLVNEGTPQRITVTTPLYRAVVSTVGGRVVSWEGLKYDTHTGVPVQLVPEQTPEYGLDAILFHDRELDLGSAVYRTEAADIRVDEGTRSLVMFASLAGGLEVRKTYTFHADTYGMEVDYALIAVDGGPARRSLELLGRPEDVRFGWNQGIAHTERSQKMEQMAMRAIARVGDEFIKEKASDLKKSEEKVRAQRRGSVHYAGLQDRYFTIVGLVPWEQGEPVEGTIRLDGDKALGAQSFSIDVPARRGVGGEIATARFDLYIGPQMAELLAVYNHGLEDSMDLGWAWIRPLTKFVLWGLESAHPYIPNYGVIIIIFSVLTKLVFYPLTRSSTISMKKMQALQPKLKAIQEKYKDDSAKLSEAQMKLYREEKVNPLAGCLPMLIPTPVFIALYQALNHTIALRGQPFVLWIKDLSQPDALMPITGSLDLNVLPILMAVAMYFQTKMTPTGGATGQMAMMNTMMPLIMVFFFYNMPSGLVLYWLVNTIMQAYQSWRIHKTTATQGA